jgi:uncharacterized protein YecE (DUF72 family)
VSRLLRVGTAGWSLPRGSAQAFAGTDSHLERYARVLNCAEINTSFYRPHRPETYARWASQTPADFRFSVKLPRAITHDGRLRAARAPLQRFLADAGELGERLGVLLVQLPPSLPFEARVARHFFGLLADNFGGAVVCEPRHASWFEPAADRLLIAAQVGRVAADPARWPAAALPGGWLGAAGDGVGALVYQRWHGSPRTYWSSYDDAWLRTHADALRRWPAGTERWCIFDNTAAGAAVANALTLAALLAAGD